MCQEEMAAGRPFPFDSKCPGPSSGQVLPLYFSEFGASDFLVPAVASF